MRGGVHFVKSTSEFLWCEETLRLLISALGPATLIVLLYIRISYPIAANDQSLSARLI